MRSYKNKFATGERRDKVKGEEAKVKEDKTGGAGYWALTTHSRIKVYCSIKGDYQHRKSQIRWSLH